MKTLTIGPKWLSIKNYRLITLAVAFPIIIFYLGNHLQQFIPTVGVLDAGIWQLLVLAILGFLGLTQLAWWLLKRGWASLGLPEINTMVLHFNGLDTWQQLAFYWASFAWLLLVAVLSLNAVL